MLHFFEVEGALVRRWVPGQRRVAMEVWNGDGWMAYSDVDNVSRRGQRLNHEQALALLQRVRESTSAPPNLRSRLCAQTRLTCCSPKPSALEAQPRLSQVFQTRHRLCANGGPLRKLCEKRALRPC